MEYTYRIAIGSDSIISSAISSFMALNCISPITCCTSGRIPPAIKSTKSCVCFMHIALNRSRLGPVRIAFTVRYDRERKGRVGEYPKKNAHTIRYTFIFQMNGVSWVVFLQCVAMPSFVSLGICIFFLSACSVSFVLISRYSRCAFIRDHNAKNTNPLLPLIPYCKLGTTSTLLMRI